VLDSPDVGLGETNRSVDSGNPVESRPRIDDEGMSPVIVSSESEVVESILNDDYVN
jgi:hypothetical protein